MFYSTQTGTAKKFAKETVQTFSQSFATKLVSLDDETDLSLKDDLKLFVVSTFGNGESPEMSRGFSLKMSTNSIQRKESKDMKNIGHFSVFGLGSSAYPKFAIFGQNLDETFGKLGGRRVFDYTAGDDQKDQKGAFSNWLNKCYRTALHTFGLKAPESNNQKYYQWKTFDSRTMEATHAKLKEFFGVPVEKFKLSARSNLHHEPNENQTILADFEFPKNSVIKYLPGDHFTVFPKNCLEKVNFLKTKMNNSASENQLMTLQCRTMNGWEDDDSLPKNVSYKDLLTYFLDINKTPSQTLLKLLASHTSCQLEKERLMKLATDEVLYEEWRKEQKVIHLESYKVLQLIRQALEGV